MDFELTTGIVAKAFNAADPAEVETLQPTVQLLSIKKVEKARDSNGPDRYRIIVSDGAQFIQAMLATQHNDLVESGQIRRHVIVRLTKFAAQNISAKRILILWNMEVLAHPESKIGEPTNIEKDMAAAANAANGEEDNQMPIDGPVPKPKPMLAVAPPRPVPATVPYSSNQQRGEKAPPIFPIEGLSPYQNKWTIKARVTYKSETKRWSNSKGEGQLFSVNLMDETCEIKATAFNAAVDVLFEKFEKGKVYFVSKGKVNIAKKAYSNLPCDYEITMDRNTEVEECMDTSGIPTIQYSFVSLSDLAQRESGAIVDVLAVVHHVSNTTDVKTKLGKITQKRELTLVDKSGYSCTLTLWGKQADTWQAMDHPVIATKGLKLGDFGGRSLASLGSSQVSTNPDDPNAHVLRGWYDAVGSQSTFIPQTSGGPRAGGNGTGGGFRREELRTIKEVKDQELGMHDNPDYFSIRGIVTQIKHDNIAYPACRGEGCNKKVNMQGDAWYCEKCNQSWDKPEYRYLLGMQVADWTTQAWLQGFNDVGAQIIGKTADELMALKEEGNDATFSNLIDTAHSRIWNFTCRAKQDTFNDQTRVRYGISRVSAPDWNEESKALQASIAQYPGMPAFVA